LIERVQPFINRALRERYQPVEAARRAQETLSGFFGLVTSMPRDLARLVKDARHGRMRVDIELKRLDEFGHRMHGAINRATIGIMTASLVVGSSIVMTVSQGPTLFGVPLLTFFGLFGYLIAFVNSLWIIFSIWRSGRR
jgi:ubiquinone biosynthesis protein